MPLNRFKAAHRRQARAFYRYWFRVYTRRRKAGLLGWRFWDAFREAEQVLIRDLGQDLTASAVRLEFGHAADSFVERLDRGKVQGVAGG